MVPPNNDPSFACTIWALISSLEQQSSVLWLEKTKGPGWLSEIRGEAMIIKRRRQLAESFGRRSRLDALAGFQEAWAVRVENE
ncbi:hypothetical protein E4U36_000451 [Claviceps purpurea]|nr:hypothetical protein E4U36_000451 [Claviceps purpurea]